VHKGGSPMTTHIARKVVQSFQKSGRVAPVHGEPVATRTGSVDCLSQGFLYKEIAEKLGIILRNGAHATSAASTKSFRSGRALKQLPNSCGAKPDSPLLRWSMPRHLYREVCASGLKTIRGGPGLCTSQTQSLI